MLDYKIIGKRIKKLRLQKTLTQEKLAEICNLSVSYISRIESSGRGARLEVFLDIVNSLGVTLDTLLKGYQINDVIMYNTEFALLFENCSCYERQIIYEVAIATKKSLQNNKINLTTCQNFDM